MSLIHETEQEKQMSEAFVNSAFLALSGGFQDAYTYLREKRSSPMPRPATWC